MNAADRFMALVQQPVKFRLFLLWKLPAAFFCGVRVKSISREKATVTVPFTWRTQNPFKSTYFACLAMAAEMSTGLLAMMNTYQSTPSVSMLVTGLQATYFKKAKGITLFTCEQGDAIAALVAAAIETGEAQTILAKSEGRNAAGELVAAFIIEWSFKRKESAISQSS